MQKESIKNLNIKELEQLVGKLEQPAFRTKQILEWLYGKQVTNFDSMTNLPAKLIEYFSRNFVIDNIYQVENHKSSDGSIKYIFAIPDDKKHLLFESVAMPSENGLTLCLSTQVGCAMACKFCATGKQGFTQNLSMGNIVDQVISIEKDIGERASNIVLMGQGEPFLNFDNVIDALSVINNKKIIGIGARKITVSTCGIINGINKFSEIDKQYTLAISLHSAIQSKRDILMPGVRNFKLKELKSALKEYVNKTNRRPTIEYVTIKDVNTSQEDLEALLDFCSGLMCHVNFINLNEISDSEFKPVSSSLINNWISNLKSNGIEATLRNSRGSDIAAACGQLINSKRYPRC